MKYNKSGARLAQELLYGFLTKKECLEGGVVSFLLLSHYKS